jgi:hypothetical protein
VDYENVIKAVLGLVPPRLDRVGIGELRTFTSKRLMGMRRPIAIDSPVQAEPLAVIVPYDRYVLVQEELLKPE